MEATPREVLGDPFYDLLEALAEVARRSVHRLTAFLREQGASTEELAAVRQRGEEIAADIDGMLAKTIMASLQRADIRELSRALRTIPGRVETTASRFILARERVGDLDFSPSIERLGQMVDALVAMVCQLRAFSNLEPTHGLNTHLQEVSDDAAAELESLVRGVHRAPGDPLRVVMAMDLIAQLESLLAACQEAACLVRQVVLRYV